MKESYIITSFMCLMMCCFILLSTSEKEREANWSCVSHTCTQTQTDVVDETTTNETELTTAYVEQYCYTNDVPLATDIQKHISDTCAEYQVPTSIVYAVIEKESSFCQDAHNDKCHGLMQLHEDYFDDSALYDPLCNITSGVELLSKYYDKYGDWRSALTAYTYGEPMFDSGEYTTEYANDVIERQKKYTHGWCSI